MKFLAIALCLAAVLANANGQLKRPPPPKKKPPPPPFVAPLCTYLAGGASSITGNSSGTPVTATAGYSFNMMKLFNATLSGTAFGKYYSVGSGAGVSGFTNKTNPVFCIGFSDDPMTDAQETTFNGQYPQLSAGVSFKLTIPAVLAGYGFFVNAGSKVTKKTQTIKMTGVDMYNIYYGAGKNTRYTWSSTAFLAAKETTVVANKTDTSFMGTTIIPYSRSDSSGTTAVFKTFFYFANCPTSTSCTSTQIAALPAELRTLSSAAFPSTWVTGATANKVYGTTALCTQANSVLGSVAYSQRAVCNPRTLLVEIKIKNAFGTYIASTDSGATLSSAVPRTTPDFDKPWSSVNLVYTIGAQTPPIASYVYFFIRKKYPASQFVVTQKFALFLTAPSTALLQAQSADLLVAVEASRASAANTAIKNLVSKY